MKWLVLIVATCCCARADAVCEGHKFAGTYGFQLSGNTTISGQSKPVATIGRLVFDGSGGVSGTSSVNYTGLLLGNPVTGTYEAQDDCSLSWSLQDDSGAYQHFTGKMTADMARIEFRQSDPGGASHGIMIRTPKSCGASALRKQYRYEMSGSPTPMLAGETAHPVSASGTLDSGKIQVDDDCIANIQLLLPVGESGATITVKLRGVLLDDGKQILAIQTNPGTTVTATLTAQD